MQLDPINNQNVKLAINYQRNNRLNAIQKNRNKWKTLSATFVE